MMVVRTAGYIGAALLCLGIGVFVVFITATSDPALRVPPIVAYLAASAFIVAAFRLLQLQRGVGGEGNGSAVLICMAFAGSGGWIAVGPGQRICGVGLPAGGVTSAEGLACRVPFGIGALLAAGIALYAALRWLRARRAADMGNDVNA